MGDKNQLKHLLDVHLTIHLYIEDEVMVPALGTLSLFQLQENSLKDEVEIEFTSRDTVHSLHLHVLEIMKTDFNDSYAMGCVCVRPSAIKF